MDEDQLYSFPSFTLSSNTTTPVWSQQQQQQSQAIGENHFRASSYRSTSSQPNGVINRSSRSFPRESSTIADFAEIADSFSSPSSRASNDCPKHEATEVAMLFEEDEATRVWEEQPDGNDSKMLAVVSLHETFNVSEDNTDNPLTTLEIEVGVVAEAIAAETNDEDENILSENVQDLQVVDENIIPNNNEQFDLTEAAPYSSKPPHFDEDNDEDQLLIGANNFKINNKSNTLPSSQQDSDRDENEPYSSSTNSEVKEMAEVSRFHDDNESTTATSLSASESEDDNAFEINTDDDDEGNDNSIKQRGHASHAKFSEMLSPIAADDERPPLVDYFDREDNYNTLHSTAANSAEEKVDKSAFLSVHSIFKNHWEKALEAKGPFRNCIRSKLSLTELERFERLINTQCWQWNDEQNRVRYDYSSRDILLPRALIPPPAPFSSDAATSAAVSPTTATAPSSSTKHLRKHQVDGIRFLWSCLVDAPTCSKRRRYDVELERQQVQEAQSAPTNEKTLNPPDEHLFPDHQPSPKTSSAPPIRVQAYGCILAHSMGLGKTAQVALFINLFAKHVIHRPRIVICTPKSTLSGWESELRQWGKYVIDGATSLEEESAECDPSTNTSIKRYKGLRTYLIDDTINKQRKMKLAHHWHSNGGVLVLGYEGLISLQRDLQKDMLARARGKKKNDNDFHRDIDIFSADCPVDLVVCDEAHRLKSNDLGAMKALQNLHPIRRLLLTGTPLQNHLMEYWTMISFTLPNFFEKKWFQQFFIRPISRALELEATSADIDLSKKKTFALIKEVEPFVQRVDSTPLKNELPKLFEYVVVVNFTPIQKTLYDAFIKLLTKQKTSVGAFNLLQANAYANKICGHPQLLYGSSVAVEASIKNKKPRVVNSDTESDEDSEGRRLDSTTSDDDSMGEMLGIGNKKKKSKNPTSAAGKSSSTKATDKKSSANNQDPALSFGTFFTIPPNYVPMTADSCKFAMAFEIIARAVANKEKVLVFSFSTQLLDLFSSLMDRDLPSSIKYFRIDGSTSGAMREEMIRKFEAGKPQDSSASHQATDRNSADVFLLSTKAGGVGLTLTTATRVIMLDTSFNPADDRQAVGRAYRYGQTRPVFVYRIVIQDSFEHRLLDQKNAKEWLFQTVVDTKTIKRDHLVGLKIRDALISTPTVSEDEWNRRHRRSAVCFRSDDKILLKLADKITFVMQHESFFEEGDDKYGEEEVRWYADYQQHAKKVADNATGLDPSLAPLLNLNGTAVNEASIRAAIASDANLKRYATLDPKNTAKEIKQMVTNDAKSLSSVINGILEQRRRESQLLLLRESGVFGRNKTSSTHGQRTNNNNDRVAAGTIGSIPVGVGIGVGAGGVHRGLMQSDDPFAANRSAPLSTYPSTSSFLEAKKRFELAKKHAERVGVARKTSSSHHPNDKNHSSHRHVNQLSAVLPPPPPQLKVTNTKDSAITLDEDSPSRILSQVSKRHTANDNESSGKKRARDDIVEVDPRRPIAPRT